MAKGKYQKWLRPEGLALLEGWARDGLTDEQIAKNIGITATTLYQWKKEYPSFSEALKKGKEVTDYEVENRLLKRAMGYDVTEYRDGKENTRHIPPDTTALIFWLKNRRPDKWRDRQDVGATAAQTAEASKLYEALEAEDDAD